MKRKENLRKEQEDQVARLRAMGFDLSQPKSKGGTIRVSCSQCDAKVINGVACHEHGCPNKKGGV